MDVTEGSQRKGRKRLRQPDKWTRNKNKKLKVSGKEYVDSKGRIVPLESTYSLPETFSFLFLFLVHLSGCRKRFVPLESTYSLPETFSFLFLFLVHLSGCRKRFLPFLWLPSVTSIASTRVENDDESYNVPLQLRLPSKCIV